ncbi:MAG TPA: SDR family oxidoreductase [Clostridium sp.]
MKTILVTGSSSGIGKATARYFAENGWNVIATMRSPEKETDLIQYENLYILKLDVEDKYTIHDAISKGIQRFGKIDVLLNNAGYGAMGLFEAATDSQIRRQFDVNFFGCIDTMKAILPHFRSNKEGTIINVSSMGGKITFPNNALYHASKFAIEGFSEAVSYELSSQNIKVKLIEPGSIKTDFAGRSMDFCADESLTDYKEYLDTINKTLWEAFDMENLSSPDFVAEVIYQAANDNLNQMRYIAGADAREIIQMRNEVGDEEYIKQTMNKFFHP